MVVTEIRTQNTKSKQTAKANNHINLIQIVTGFTNCIGALILISEVYSLDTSKFSLLLYSIVIIISVFSSNPRYNLNYKQIPTLIRCIIKTNKHGA